MPTTHFAIQRDSQVAAIALVLKDTMLLQITNPLSLPVKLLISPPPSRYPEPGDQPVPCSS